ncbi:MAG: hypothetical protein NTZ73_01735 [Candidatus Diapherotrites archaeon]|nr:hypothetical protein [Candidatus Diapherotrites archaeon]
MANLFNPQNIQDKLKNPMKKLFSSQASVETKQIMLYATGLIIIPLLSNNQLITGAFVNTILILAALNYSLKKTFFLSFIPSTTIFLTGFFFGGVTAAIALMLPFIWAGNFLLMLATKKLFIEKKKNYFISATGGALAKTALLFCSATMLASFSLIPIVFVSTFGIMQLATAESGAMIAFILKKAKR